MPAPKPDRVTLDDLAESFKVTTVSQYSDRVAENSDVYGHAHKAALKEGLSEEAADAAAQKVEQEEADEAVFKYMNAITIVADKLYAEHGLMLVPLTYGKKALKRHPFEFNVVPVRSWQDAADKIRQTINGVGYFEFRSLKEFLDSGPYTPKQAVLQHLHWIPDYPRVYGSGTASSMVDRQLRR